MAIRSLGQRNESLCRIRSLPHSFSGTQATAYEELRILDIMLSACIYQVDGTLEGFQPSVLRERAFKAFQCNEQILETKINRKTPPAVLCLVAQGSLPCGEFKMFTGPLQRRQSAKSTDWKASEFWRCENLRLTATTTALSVSANKI